MLDITFIDKHNAQCSNFFLADNYRKKDPNTHCKSFMKGVSEYNERKIYMILYVKFNH